MNVIDLLFALLRIFGWVIITLAFALCMGVKLIKDEIEYRKWRKDNK